MNGIMFNKENGLFIPKLAKNKTNACSNTGACALLTVSVIYLYIVLSTCVVHIKLSNICQFWLENAKHFFSLILFCLNMTYFNNLITIPYLFTITYILIITTYLLIFITYYLLILIILNLL